MRYNTEKEIFEVTEEGKEEDLARKEEKTETDCQRMACMNSINPDLVFTWSVSMISQIRDSLH